MKAEYTNPRIDGAKTNQLIWTPIVETISKREEQIFELIWPPTAINNQIVDMR